MLINVIIKHTTVFFIIVVKNDLFPYLNYCLLKFNFEFQFVI